MGVYVFEVKNTTWIKVGHHKITHNRPNVYFRVARRGFHSCVHPAKLSDKLDEEHLTLLRWYPTLTKREERLAHRSCRVSHGEFHARSDLPHAIACLDAHGASEPVSPSQRTVALKWAKKIKGA